MNINDSIDRYFHPQIDLLEKFNVPSKFHVLDLHDFRDLFWDIDNDGFIRLFKEIGSITIVRRFIFETFKCDNIKALLVSDPFSSGGQSFMIINEFKKLIIKNGKFKLAYDLK